MARLNILILDRHVFPLLLNTSIMEYGATDNHPLNSRDLGMLFFFAACSSAFSSAVLNNSFVLQSDLLVQSTIKEKIEFVFATHESQSINPSWYLVEQEQPLLHRVSLQESKRLVSFNLTTLCLFLV